MKKKHIRLIVIVGILIILVITFGVYQQLRTTTYEKVLPDSISENNDIEQITIRYCNSEENAENDKTMTLKDSSDITQIVKQPKDMNLKKTSKEYKNLYLLEFKAAEERPRLLTISEQDTLTISGSLKKKDHYKINGQNHLVEAIEANRINGSPLPKTLVL